MRKIISSATIILTTDILNTLQGQTKTLHLSLQTRDPNTNQIINKTEDVETVHIVPWGKPEGSRFINLVGMDAGSRTMLDTGNWVDAGFITKKIMYC